MYIQEFSKGDIILNRIKTNPRFEFRISKEGNFSLKNRPASSQVLLGNEIGLNDFLLTLPALPEEIPLLCEPNSFDFTCVENSYNISLI